MKQDGITPCDGHKAAALLLLGLGLLILPLDGLAQDQILSAPAAPSSVKVGSPVHAKPTGPAPPAAKPDGKAVPNKGAQGKKDAKGEQPSEPEVVKRPTTSPEASDPAQFQIKPDADGKVRFSFVGAPWPDLLRWLADVSGKSLDWQELPADYLNLVTQRRYTIEEAQDVINRHLLARGFTLLQTPETLTVVNVKKLDPALVPRLEPDELAEHNPHEFAKVSFELPWLPAETAVKELKPMISPNGKLSALSATNRLEAMDAVINLREIHRVLTQEQSSGGRNRLVRVFKLKHTRAAEVLDQLKGLLGLNSKQPALPMNPQQLAQLQQQMQRMAQQPGGKPAPAANNNKEEVHLVVNTRENSILAHAPPDKMAVIAQAVEAIDVEPDHTPLLRNLEGVRVYRLNALNPETLIKILEKTGDLSPGTQLEVDEKNKAVIAFASAVDHLTIQMVVDKLDGSNRQFEVIPLRKLEAEYVAGTVQRMLGGEDDEGHDRGPSRYYYYYDPFTSRRNSDSGSTDKFRVDADVEYNRLLVWANEIELQEVENLLIKLGEIPPKGGNPNTVRVIDSAPGEATEDMLKRLRRLWPSIAPNELILPPNDATKSQEKKSAPDARAPQHKPSSDLREAAEQMHPSVTVSMTRQQALTPGPSPRGRGERGEAFALAEPSEPGAGSADVRVQEALDEPVTPRRQPPQPDDNVPQQHEPSPPALLPKGEGSGVTDEPPVSITRRPDGRLIISSQDTRALDQLEEILRQLAPPRPDYKVFKLKYSSTWAWGVAYNLEDFFKQDDKNDRPGFDPYYGYYYGSSGGSDSSRRLSNRPPPKFIADEDSHTILVQGASPEQLKIIEDLIDVYDQPPDADPKSVRNTELFHVKYSKAEVIAKAIKDVYRDLLSSNDPALQTNQNQKNQRTQTVERSYTYVYGGGNDEKEPQTPIKFKGLLSVGVDDVSNILIVSAPERLLENIRSMVEALDEAAKPPAMTVQVVPSNGIGINTAALQALVHHAATGKPLEQPPQQPQQPESRQPQQPNHSQQNQQQTVPQNGPTAPAVSSGGY